MLTVHVRLDLEHERGKRRARGDDSPVHGFATVRRWRQVHERVEERLDPEIVQRAAEEDRRLPSGEEAFHVVVRKRTFQQGDVVAQLRCRRVADRFAQRVAVERHLLHRRAAPFRRALEPEHPVSAVIVDALERRARPDGPVQWNRWNRERALDLVEEFDRCAARLIELVDEGQNRRLAQPAHFEEPSGLRFDALGCVEHHHRAIDRHQRAVGVFAEVLVTRGVEQIDDAAAVLELQCGRGDRDPARPFDFHPVGRDGALRLPSRGPRRRSRWRRRRAAASQLGWFCRHLDAQ